MTFPGAQADRDEAAYVLVGAPLDASTSGQPGTRYGPARIRRFAGSFEDYDHRTDTRFTDCAVHDDGDVDPWSDVDAFLETLVDTLDPIRRAGALPVLLGGEHTVTLAGVRAVEPDVYVCLDAHLDLRDDFGGDRRSHATVTRRALETASEAVLIGVRSGSEPGWARAAESDVTVVAPPAAADWTPAFDPGDTVYLSVDVDAADPGFAPGTGTPEPFGLTPGDMREIVAAVAPRCVGFDVVEVNDRDDGQAATLGAKLLRTFVLEHASA